MNKNDTKTQSQNLNELNVVIKTATDQELVNESGVTIVTTLMQQDGKIMSSFMGDYNKNVLKTLKKVNNMYFKKLHKELIANKKKDDKNADKKVDKDTKKKVSKKTSSTNVDKNNTIKDKQKSVKKSTPKTKENNTDEKTTAKAKVNTTDKK